MRASPRHMHHTAQLCSHNMHGIQPMNQRESNMHCPKEPELESCMDMGMGMGMGKAGKPR
jgi:hypothetical protein